mmetsp:Transcript_22592/g.70821  ORF Transcript_22592/g.70821 Transcript_22592/m.70821 type:complete len:259 (-) Transcript_22592:282-1058(-)
MDATSRSSDDRAEADRGTRALYARHVVRRDRVDKPWSQAVSRAVAPTNRDVEFIERAVAPLLGGVATFPRVAGAVLARRPLQTRELYLYHSGRAPPARTFSLPEDVLRLVFDALARVSVEKAGPEPDGWDRDEALFTAVLRSVWVEKFSLMSAIDVVKATVPLARVSKSWRDALRGAVQLRRGLLDQYRRDLSEKRRNIPELQRIYHSQWPISSDSSHSSEDYDFEDEEREELLEEYRNSRFPDDLEDRDPGDSGEDY